MDDGKTGNSSWYQDFRATGAVEFPLPPPIEGVEAGKITWRLLGQIDFELMGYLLSCHLTVEHYMDEFLRSRHPELDWHHAKLNFFQKIELLTNWGSKLKSHSNPVPIIKHLHSLRNKFGHHLNYTLTREDMLPFVQFLERISGGEASQAFNHRELLHTVTWCCCASLVYAIQLTGAKPLNAAMPAAPKAPSEH